jgi:hypothetical protein
LLGNVPEGDLDGLTPGRGEHNPTVDLGVEPSPAEASSRQRLAGSNQLAVRTGAS